ncbi:MAG: hypothetical protein FWD13_01330 [Treponema sp.]|nr:hypothetical protein [Treponema sp.]
MLQWQNKYLCILLFFVICNSCGFIDLRPIGISIEPDTMNSLLPDSYSPVILKFDTEMEKTETEGILQIGSDNGSVKGDKYWDGNDLYFVPVSGWAAGTRYTLNLAGSMRSVDGRELRIERFIPFYAINRNSHPELVRYTPSNGESTGTNNVIFEFYFSRSMNKQSVESALTLDGIGNKTFEWSADDTVLKIVPEKNLSPWVLYRWNLKDSAKSTDGVQLSKSYSGYIKTDLDQVLPQITNIYPMLKADGCWYPTGADIETNLRQGQGIAVTFNKPMGDNALRSLRFEPSLSGRAEFLSEDSIVYIFSRDPEPDTTYTLIISGDTRDSEGLKLGNEFRINFTPDIPILEVLSLTVNDNTVLNNFTALNNLLPVQIDSGTGKLFFSIYFSLPFNYQEKLNLVQKITLTPFFPRTLPPIALEYVSWISDDRLYMRWEGLTSGEDDIHFYKLTIPGGKGGISSDTGIHMNENITVYLEVVK